MWALFYRNLFAYQFDNPFSAWYNLYIIKSNKLITGGNKSDINLLLGNLTNNCIRNTSCIWGFCNKWESSNKIRKFCF